LSRERVSLTSADARLWWGQGHLQAGRRAALLGAGVNVMFDRPNEKSAEVYLCLPWVHCQNVITLSCRVCRTPPFNLQRRRTRAHQIGEHSGYSIRIV